MIKAASSNLFHSCSYFTIDSEGKAVRANGKQGCTETRFSRNTPFEQSEMIFMTPTGTCKDKSISNVKSKHIKKKVIGVDNYVGQKPRASAFKYHLCILHGMLFYSNE